MVIIIFAYYMGISRTFEKLMTKSSKTGQVQAGLWVTLGLIFGSGVFTLILEMALIPDFDLT